MKITGFETIPIRGRSMVLKMFTDEGLVGFGEPMNYEHWRPVAASSRRYGRIFGGQGPLADRGPLAGDVPIQLQPEYAGVSRCAERNRDGDVGCIRQERWGCLYGNCWAARCVDVSVYTRLRVVRHRRSARRTRRLLLREASAR